MNFTIEWLGKVFREWQWLGLGGLFIAAIVLLVLLSGAMGEMGFIGLFSNAISLVLLPIAVGMVFVSLRAADRLGAIKFDRLRAKILAEPMSASVYATGRWIALAIIISAVLR